MKTNLKQLRKAAGWSNADDFARSINMAPKTYRNYEQGVRQIGLDVASDICNALGCSINDLVTEQVSYAFVRLSNELNDDERELLALYRSLSTDSRDAVMLVARTLAKNS
jgi:transcriptional regulator with XRE-family HTH domain